MIEPNDSTEKANSGNVLMLKPCIINATTYYMNTFNKRLFCCSLIHTNAILIPNIVNYENYEYGAATGEDYAGGISYDYESGTHEYKEGFHIKKYSSAMATTQKVKQLLR